MSLAWAYLGGSRFNPPKESAPAIKPKNYKKSQKINVNVPNPSQICLCLGLSSLDIGQPDRYSRTRGIAREIFGGGVGGLYLGKVYPQYSVAAIKDNVLLLLRELCMFNQYRYMH